MSDSADGNAANDWVLQVKEEEAATAASREEDANEAAFLPVEAGGGRLMMRMGEHDSVIGTEYNEKASASLRDVAESGGVYCALGSSNKQQQHQRSDNNGGISALHQAGDAGLSWTKAVATIENGRGVCVSLWHHLLSARRCNILRRFA